MYDMFRRVYEDTVGYLEHKAVLSPEWLHGNVA